MTALDCYPERFECEVYACLGGVEPSREFFFRHPELIHAMREAGFYHRLKGGYPDRGADVFFQQTLRPIIRADRAAAVKRPWS